MPRIDDEDKRQRLERIHLLLARNARGVTEAEIAAEINLERRTVNNYLRELEYQGRALKDGLYWYPLVLKESRLRSFDLTPEEAVTLYLGTRLLSKQQDKRNEPAETALLKLASVLKADAGVGAEIEQAARELAQRPIQKDYQPIFREVVRGYIYRKKIEIAYRPLNWDKAFQTTFSTYLLEPSPIGFTTYLIGHSSIVDARRAYKLERIESVRLTREDYSIPPDFPGLDILRNAWSIIMGEETVRVLLRFSPGVKERVLETRWHPSQDYEEEPDGKLRWWVDVAGTLDLLPWIRGWGADVEVLEPESLRKTLEQEASSLANLYGVGEMEILSEQYYAHTKDGTDESEWQLLKNHLAETGQLAFELGTDAGIAELARTAGLLHDLGKYSKEFQARLRGSKQRVDHATAGAREIMNLFPQPPEKYFAELLSYCIAGHHSGLPDYGSKADTETEGTLLARREKKSLKNYDAYKKELDLASLQIKPRQIKPARFCFDGKEKTYLGYSVSFLTRMLFSTLTDADWLETERYVQGDTRPREQHANIETLAQQFNAYLSRFDNPANDINRKRTETLKACIAKADQEPGFFTLTVPTGGGKTFASMAFALNHAVKNGLKRIIYVIPFTSIIEQNAGEFRKALGEFGAENILEHHSNFDWEGQKKKKTEEEANDETHKVNEKIKLAAENWDVPIVVTTNVQFFESLFASKKRSARKLHNIAKSVIIFDEAQMLPREYLKPCLLAVQELVNNYGATAVFCTATQPSLGRFFPEKTQFTELAPIPQALFDFYRRVNVRNLGAQTDEDLVEKLNTHEQALCIVNTRRHAKGLYEKLDDDEGSFHLSTVMCPAHRTEILTEVRQRLKDGRPCRVVSTQLMEAGIDVDFPVGYRAFAGLDSIIQAAGRVNREGKQARSDVFVFNPKTEFIKRTPLFIAQTSAVAESTLRNFGDDPTSIAAIEAYYETLYTLQSGESFDFKKILGCFEKVSGKPDFDFKTAAENFKFIENNTVSVIIPFGDKAQKLIEELIEKLRYTAYIAKTVRKLQTYTVNIYEGEFMNLQGKGVIHTIGERYHVLDAARMEEYYHPKTGLTLPERGSGEAIFFD